MGCNIMAMRWSRLSEGTPAELAIEDAIAALGVPYRFQFPGYRYGLRYFPDFYLPTLKLVIEVDDPSHDKKVEEDAERSARIEQEWGARVVRCTNEKALQDPYGAVKGCLADAGLLSAQFAMRLGEARSSRSLPRMAAAIPPLRRAPRKEKRAAKAAARRSARRKGRTRRYGIRPTPKDRTETIQLA